MFSKERPLPKALNIIRPSPPPFIQDYSSAASSPSEISTISNYSGPTQHHSLFPNNVNNFKTVVGVNPHRFLQRPRSNSNFSTFFSTFSTEEPIHHPPTQTEDDELDSIDGLTDDEHEQNKVVAKIKHGTIMNGKGEFLNRGDHDPWSDEARANRKIADLEIENQTLLLLNASLETKLRQQTVQIGDLEKQLQAITETPLTPVSVENKEDEEDEMSELCRTIEQNEIETEKSFLRIQSALEGLIDQAQEALVEEEEKTKRPMRVLSPHEQERRRQSSPPILLRHPSSSSIQSVHTLPARRSTTPRPSSRLSIQPTEKPKWTF
ncbi:hypothetical protein BY458DRAFT_517576 [Sporodiniella umbellata]|nr:hypothetical protein BY458DRAFT_517576 [Sporodiniella umbellata]